MIDKMMSLADDEGINIRYVNFSPPLQGLYCCESALPPVIFISKAITKSSSLFACVLAEELGHHFTTIGDCIPKSYYSYADRMKVDKMEYKALRWAANYLIPENELLDVLKSGLFEPWELADHFNVTDEMALFRLRLFKLKQYG